DHLFSPVGFRLIQIVQLIAALLLITDLFPGYRFVLCLVVTLCLLLFGLRHIVGTEGADQMLVILFFSLTIAYSVPYPPLRKVCMAFIAAQLLLSYLIAGVAKLISPAWRNGRAMLEINRAESFGNHAIYRFLS